MAVDSELDRVVRREVAIGKHVGDIMHETKAITGRWSLSNRKLSEK